MSANADKRENEGYIKFIDAFKSGIIVFGIASFLGIIFNFILNYVIDPTLQDVQLEATKDMMIGMMEYMGVPEDAIDDALAELKKPTPLQFFQQMIYGFMGALMIGAIPAAIIGLIVKKHDPREDIVESDTLDDHEVMT